MSERKTYPQALVWIDIESDSLPEGNDYSNVGILEIAGVVTDFDLTKFNGVHDVVKLTQAHVTNLKKNPTILEMHKDSGLIVECSKSENTLRDLEEQMIQLLKDSSFDKQEYILAGSGVATFDMPLIQTKMPELASWLQYYTMDIGILRRSVFYLSHRRQFVKDVRKSFQPGHKKHRAFDDVLAHIEEAEQYKDWLRGLPEG